MTKAALYIRVSTREQVENYSIEVQKERLEAFCKAKGWDVYNVYIDGGYSGSTLDRPDLQRMLKDLKKIDAIVVYKLDRLSRSQKDTLELIEEHFLKKKVDFVSVTETLDTSTSFGKAMIGILSVFAQLERESIAERMRMGHIKRAENGFSGMGGDYDPAGFTRQHGLLVPLDYEVKHIQRAFDLYEQYHSITQVQAVLKEEGYPVWRFRRYRDILSNELYLGRVKFAGKAYKGKHKAIISTEQFERVQTLLDRHKGHNAHKAKNSLLSGLLTCKHCGESFVSYSTGAKNRKNNKAYYYYVCRARKFPSEYEEKCMNKNWNRTKLEDIVLTAIKNMSMDFDTQQKKKRPVDFEKLIKDVDKKIERLIDLYTIGKVKPSLIDKKIDVLNAEKDSIISRQKDETENAQSITVDLLNTLQKKLEEMEFRDKRAAILTLVKQIYINDTDVDIEWRF
ncbi:recombinase family protein [Peribacillus loiseleuriae]|uniref:recombinase family protein n=1 Tax=Peribacillus loiseleuriae TaxID=1679170 RepID=UPI003D01CBF8